MHLLVDRQDIERERREERATVVDRAHLTARRSFRDDARDEWRRRDTDRDLRAGPGASRENAARDPRRRAEELLGAREVAREDAPVEHAYARQRGVEGREQTRMHLRGRDDRERHRIPHTASSARSARVPRSVRTPSARQKSARSLADARPTANVQPTVRSNRRSQATRSKTTVGIAMRRPRFAAMTRSAAGEPRTAGSAGARVSTSVPPKTWSPASTTTRRKPSLRSADAVASATASRGTRTTMTRSRSMPARSAASGSNDVVGSIHAAIPPCACAPAAARSASESFPTLGGPTNASGSPAARPPPMTRSSEFFVAMTISPRRRSLVSPRASACTPKRPSIRAMAPASPGSPTGRSPYVRSPSARSDPVAGHIGVVRTDVLQHIRPRRPCQGPFGMTERPLNGRNRARLSSDGQPGTGTLQRLRGGCLHPARGRERHALRALLRAAPRPLPRGGPQGRRAPRLFASQAAELGARDSPRPDHGDRLPERADPQRRISRKERHEHATCEEGVVDPGKCPHRAEKHLAERHEPDEDHRLDAHDTTPKCVRSARLHERGRHTHEDHHREARKADERHRPKQRALHAEEEEQRSMREGRAGQERAASPPATERRRQERSDERAGSGGREQPRELERADAEELRFGGKQLDIRTREKRGRDAEGDNPAKDRVTTDERQSFADRVEHRESRTVVNDRLRSHQQKRRDDSRAGLRDEQQAPTVRAVGHDAAEESERESRDRPREPREPEIEGSELRHAVLGRELDDEPAEPELLHPRPDVRDHKPDPEEAEIAVLERRPGRGAAGFGRRGLVQRLGLELGGKVLRGHVLRECMGVEPTTDRSTPRQRF